jgi:sugar lactone lactonase YvrE
MKVRKKAQILAILLMLALLGGCGDGSSSQSDNSNAGTRSVGGMVSGLFSGQQVTLQNNGGGTTTISTNGSFTFSEMVPSNSNYDVTVLSQPSSDKFSGCSVSNGTGTITSNVTNVSVGCGPIVSTFAGSGTASSVDGQGMAASFTGPRGMTFDQLGNLYVVEYWSAKIRKIDPSGNVTTFAGSGSQGYAEGQGTNASFHYIMDIASDANNNLYVADQYNNRIRKIDPTGNVTTFANVNQPVSITLGNDGNFYVGQFQTGFAQVSKISSSGVVTVLAGSGAIGNSDGLGTAATFASPVGLVMDSAGALYVTDFRNNTIRKIDVNGNVSTFAGSGTASSIDGQGTAASFNAPFGLTIDANDNLYVAGNLDNSIRKIDPSGNVTTIVGTGSAIESDGQGSAASFNRPMYIKFNNSGNALYVSDTPGNVIRKISPGG